MLKYEDNVLVELKMDTVLTALQFEFFFSNLVYKESDFKGIPHMDMEHVPEAVNEKIAMFCRYYKRFLGISYKVMASDVGKIKLISPDEKLLEAYFTTQNFLFKDKYSISNLVKYFNELCASVSKKVYPNHYSKQIAAQYSGSDLVGYWEHLRKLGFQPIKKGGITIDWQKR